MKFLTLFILLSSSSLLAEIDEDCVQPTVMPVRAESTKDYSKIARELFKPVVGLEVRYDGEGALSVYFENGEPKSLRLYYKDREGVVTDKNISFEDLKAGKQLIYENQQYPGKAITVEKNEPFKANNDYQFKVIVRTKLPDGYTPYSISFHAHPEKHSVQHEGEKFRKLEFIPGRKRITKWNGTFEDLLFIK